ncbi:MAG: Ig-like domain repeat protein, partial [Caldilinea sp.]|nr:Ig-like domain repeat protein [Caldilinea sp.]
FFADGASLGTATLAAGKAQVATGGLTVGTHVITATFTPAGPYLASNGTLAPVQQVVSPPLTARNDAAGTLQGEA